MYFFLVELAQLSVREAPWRSNVKVAEAGYLIKESCTVFINKTFEISKLVKTPKHLFLVVLVLALLS